MSGINGMGGMSGMSGIGESRTLRVRVNGSPRELAAGTALDAVVALLTPARSGVAAALNETVVPRDRWAGTVLADGDRVEVLTAVQGG
jgi:sulfur carrier protein